MLTLGKSSSNAHRRYTIRTMAFMTPYVLVCLAAIGGVFDEVIGKPSGWVLAAAVSAPVIGQIWATLALMRESDEFVRAVVAKQFILSAGAAMGVAVFWGFGESFAGAPHLPAWLVYAAFWGCYGVIAPFVRSSN